MTQTQRVLAALKNAGARGITQSDFAPPEGGHVIDGQGRITRVAARVRDLRDEGHRIVTNGERAGFTVYMLVGLAETRPSPHPDGTPREWVCGRCWAHHDSLIGPVCPNGHPAQIVTVISPTGTLVNDVPGTSERRAA